MEEFIASAVARLILLALGIYLLVLILEFIESHWYVVLPIGILVGIAGYALRRLWQRLSSRWEHEQQQEAERQERERDRAEAAIRLLNWPSEAQRMLQDIAALLVAAGEHVNRAGAEFRDRAFSPFWDQIEDATSILEEYHQHVAEYLRQVKDIARMAVKHHHEVYYTLDPIPDSRHTETRVAGIVRKAQRDPEFARIYEQRRTTKLLVEKFETLIDDLAVTHELSQERLNATLEGLSEDMLADAAEHREFEKKTLEKQDDQTRMLDDIRRRKKPMP